MLMDIYKYETHRSSLEIFAVVWWGRKWFFEKNCQCWWNMGLPFDTRKQITITAMMLIPQNPRNFKTSFCKKIQCTIIGVLSKYCEWSSCHKAQHNNDFRPHTQHRCFSTYVAESNSVNPLQSRLRTNNSQLFMHFQKFLGDQKFGSDNKPKERLQKMVQIHYGSSILWPRRYNLLSRNDRVNLCGNYIETD